MTSTVKEVLDFVHEQDVKFIRLAFCDLFGRQKNVSIMPSELERAFESGISFDGSAVPGFSGVVDSDLFLFPEAHTLSILPWRPQQGRVVRFYCTIKRPDGTSYEGDTRNILQTVINSAEQKGYSCNMGAECEFYLFKTGEDGQPLHQPFDFGGYMDIAPLDRGENVRREICLCLEEMGIRPEASHHEQGPGQNEIDFTFSDAITAADNLFTFKTVVRTISARNGLFASFMPKPILDKSGSGMHLNISLKKDGKDIFENCSTELSSDAGHFIAGILDKTPEITAFLNPITNSYERFGAFEAPKYVSWSHQNRSQLVRIPAANSKSARMELRSPDSAANPYLAFALTLAAGIDGIEKKLPLPKEVTIDLYNADKASVANLKQLPSSLAAALKEAQNSAFVKTVIAQDVLDKFIAYKEKEVENCLKAPDKQTFYNQRYFPIV